MQFGLIAGPQLQGSVGQLNKIHVSDKVGLKSFLYTFRHYESAMRTFLILSNLSSLSDLNHWCDFDWFNNILGKMS